MAWAELSDVRCYYELLGQGDPVLMIPGLGATCRLWDPIVPELAAHFSVITPDNRGVGQSVGRRPAKHLTDYVVDLIELMDRLQLDRAHVIGLSLGGMIAQRLAIEHPSRVDRLVLMSCAHQFGPYLRGMAMLLAQSLRHFPWELYVQTMELLGTSPKHYDANPNLVRNKIELQRTCGISRAAVVRQLQCLHASELDICDYRIKAPTLVIAGQHDALIPSCYAEQMAACIPQSEFWIVPHGGHNPASEFPELVAPRITEFLNAKNDKRARADIVAAGRFRNIEEGETTKGTKSPKSAKEVLTSGTRIGLTG